tara:strand:+ start:1638 stop:1790 length:153 start_codon:yes stop_codon:yes gene_type:complete
MDQRRHGKHESAGVLCSPQGVTVSGKPHATRSIDLFGAGLGLMAVLALFV